MFLGAIPADLRSIVSEHTRSWEIDEVWIGCSGAFTIERTLRGRFKLRSNDVSIYSSAIGAFYARQPFRLELKGDHAESLGWLNPYLQDQVDALATVLLASAMLAGYGKPSNPYYERMFRGYRQQWEAAHAKTVAKLEAMHLPLESYFCGDVMEYVEGVPADGGMAAFPPFYLGGYEVMFKVLDEVFDWDEPSYEMMDGDSVTLLLEKMQEKRHWLFGTDHRKPELERSLRGIVQPTNRNVPIYVYSSGGGTRVAMPRQNTEPVTAPRLLPDEELGGRLALAPLTMGQFAALRSKYLDVAIAPALPLAAVGVLCDGKLIGCFAWSAGKFGGGAYLMSDFPIAPTRYERLAKLIVCAALSTEAQLLMERSIGKRVRSIATTAFTDRPVSMKYRGVLDLTKRTECGAGSPWRYQLQYESRLGRWTLQKALHNWKAKHGGAIREEMAA